MIFVTICDVRFFLFSANIILFTYNNSHILFYPIVIEGFKIPGVIETGLFVNMAFKAYFGMPDGTVQTRLRPAQINGDSVEH